MKRLTVSVTEEDINAARIAYANPEVFKACSCPIAQALKRIGLRSKVWPNPFEPGFAHIWSTHGTDPEEFTLSEAANKFGIDFDSSLPVKPATFRLARADA